MLPRGKQNSTVSGIKIYITLHINPVLIYLQANNKFSIIENHVGKTSVRWTKMLPALQKIQREIATDHI